MLISDYLIKKYNICPVCGEKLNMKTIDKTIYFSCEFCDFGGFIEIKEDKSND